MGRCGLTFLGIGVWHALTDEDHVFQEKFTKLISSLHQLIAERIKYQSVEIVYMHQYPINQEGYRFHVDVEQKVGHDLTSDKIFRYNTYIKKSLE